MHGGAWEVDLAGYGWGITYCLRLAAVIAADNTRFWLSPPACFGDPPRSQLNIQQLFRQYVVIAVRILYVYDLPPPLTSLLSLSPLEMDLRAKPSPPFPFSPRQIPIFALTRRSRGDVRKAMKHHAIRSHEPTYFLRPSFSVSHIRGTSKIYKTSYVACTLRPVHFILWGVFMSPGNQQLLPGVCVCVYPIQESSTTYFKRRQV